MEVGGDLLFPSGNQCQVPFILPQRGEPKIKHQKIYRHLPLLGGSKECVQSLRCWGVQDPGWTFNAKTQHSIYNSFTAVKRERIDDHADILTRSISPFLLSVQSSWHPISQIMIFGV